MTTPPAQSPLPGFPNYAGRSDVDLILRAELEAAGIPVETWPECMRGDSGEVKTVVRGVIAQSWVFQRYWSYWVARGNGVPADAAMRLWESHGQEARAEGDAGCRSPLFWNRGLGTGSYHIDTPAGLKALALTIKGLIVERPAES